MDPPAARTPKRGPAYGKTGAGFVCKYSRNFRDIFTDSREMVLAVPG